MVRLGPSDSSMSKSATYHRLWLRLRLRLRLRAGFRLGLGFRVGVRIRVTPRGVGFGLGLV